MIIYLFRLQIKCQNIKKEFFKKPKEYNTENGDLHVIIVK